MFPSNPMMQVIQTYRQIKQNPNQLAPFLRQRGIITDAQATEINNMNGHYSQIGQYLMNQGRMPNNVDQYKGQVEQIQSTINNQQ